MKTELIKCEKCGMVKELQTKQCGMCLFREGKLNIGLYGKEELDAVKTVGISQEEIIL